MSNETKALYYQVNCELAAKVAKKAKAEGVRQFVSMTIDRTLSLQEFSNYQIYTLQESIKRSL